MIDMNREVAAVLKDICTVQLAFPEVNSEFPYVSLSEIGNTAAAILDSKERYSRYECQLDVWDTAENGSTPERCVKLAETVSDTMISAGFTRVAGKLMKDPSGLHRYMMGFTGWVDNKTKTIYRGGF